ncbi:MAG: hypothetical protein K0U86_04210 [Planctomycetes bacterium]|nr:hypothetical protein [Planctomycetota bacterium]MCH9724090.1 hypothetical protein [Planctomycetota bacterium]MCH9778146.1 hypothetical protein [Planctomycetota bacterium]MCH9793365.1 hypothetical protein [Planctomycetota bacterium]
MDSEQQTTPRPESHNERHLLPTSISLWIPLLHLLFVILLFCFLAPFEWARIQSENQNLPLLTRFFLHVNVDTTPYLILLLLSPICWFLKPCLNNHFFSQTLRPRLSQQWVIDKQKSQKCDYPAIFLCLIVAFSSFLMSFWTSAHIVNQELNLALGDLPPAYHDEFSYLFQAKTFLAGRTWFPSHPDVPEIFDQVHVLNEGKMASRYFPGTGLWLAPFVAWGHPYWGYWLAGAITACFIFWSGRELGGNGVGFLAGFVIALSPGMAIFSNLLLAHHPTLIGLSIFLWAFLRMQRTRSFWDAFLAGLGLTFAMLCRPMTAAGFALPFGIWLVLMLIRSCFRNKDNTTQSEADKLKSPRSAWVLIVGLAIPIGSGLTSLFFYNQSITGSGWKMPYQVYTDIYTPRHVYGFNNVIRGEQKLGPKVLHNYDIWAQNLTPELAIQNVQNRFVASLQWTLGLVPLGLAGLVFLITECRHWSRWWLVFASIVSLHIVHIPYWYDGIMHWHYVFETGPLWALVFARVTQTLFRIWHRLERPLMSWLWSLMIIAALLANLTAFSPMWTISKLEIVVNNVAFSKLKHFQLNSLFQQYSEIKKPAIVLIQHNANDRHIDYIINDPSLDQEILRGRYLPEKYSPENLQSLFPDRQLYQYDAGNRALYQWNGKRWEKFSL